MRRLGIPRLGGDYVAPGRNRERTKKNVCLPEHFFWGVIIYLNMVISNFNKGH
jgi:hypothetical protein